jgi:hypothetical protein
VSCTIMTFVGPWPLTSRSNNCFFRDRSMHPHTNYHWPTSKDKNVMARTRKYYSKTIIWPWGQRSKVIMVRDTPPYGHAPTYEISLTYLERQKSYGPDKLRWEEVEEEEKIRLKQYVSLRSKGRHNKIEFAGRHVTSLWHIILIPSQLVSALSPYCCL